MGAPSIYSEEVADAICGRLAEGESLRAICRHEGMPSIGTVMRWLTEDDKLNFREQYTRARELGLEALAEDIRDIADTPVLGVKTKINEKGETETTEADMIEHRRLQIDARKWLLSKLVPKKYGDKTTLAGDPEAPLQGVVVIPAKEIQR